MKRIIIIISLLLSTIFTFYSCTKENDLLNDGDNRESFVGDWAANDHCSKQAYGVSLSLDLDNSSLVLISNFANTGHTATGVVAGGSIYVEYQSIGGGYSVNGNGILTGDIISWTTYNFETEGNLSECTCTFTKK